MATDNTNDLDTIQQCKRMRRGLLDNHYVQSARFRSLLDKVWKRIPKLDRAILRSMIEVVTDGFEGTARPKGVFGSASHFMGSDLIDGVECVKPRDAKIYIDSNNLAEWGDSVALAVIAHELAHVILRHPSMASPFVEMSEIRPEEIAKLKEVHEWEADLQAWLWGFSSELRDLWHAIGIQPPPWYHQFLDEERSVLTGE